MELMEDPKTSPRGARTVFYLCLVRVKDSEPLWDALVFSGDATCVFFQNPLNSYEKPQYHCFSF